MTCSDTGCEENEAGPGIEGGGDSSGLVIENKRERTLPADSAEETAVGRWCGSKAGRTLIRQRQKGMLEVESKQAL